MSKVNNKRKGGFLDNMKIRKKCRIWGTDITIFICMVVMVCMFYHVPVLAAVRNTDVTVAAPGNTLISVEGTFYSNTKTEILNRINAIRKEACTEGVTNPSTGEALTTADYVPIKWSSDLEWIAQTRAAEATVSEGHTRPNGKSCFAISHNGVKSWAEVLAWNYSGMMEGIEQWYGEKEDWVNNTGAVTGHYTSMINPENTYIGLGCFLLKEGGWYAVAGEFSYKQDLAEEKIGVTGSWSQQIEVPASSLSASLPGNISINVGAKKKLDFTVTTARESAWGGEKTSKCSLVDNRITWSSSDGNIISVDGEGTITANKPGTVTITATASNGLKASVKATVKAPKKVKVAKAKTPKLANLKGGKLKITYAATSGAKGYQIQYATNSKFKKAKSKTLKKKNYTVKLKKGKKYYVRVRAYKLDASKQKVYGSWSKVKSIKIKK